MDAIVVGSDGDLITLDTGQVLTEVTAMEMHAVKPDGQMVIWEAELSSAPGSIQYITQTGDIDQVGIWKISAYLEWGSTSKHTSPIPMLLNVLAPGSYILTINGIRNAINILNTETNELSDDVITSAIERAIKFSEVLAAHHGAPEEYFAPCREAHAIYLAYQSYADRVLNVQPGAYEEGKWTPVTEEIVRETQSKLDGLRQNFEDLKGLIEQFPRRYYGPLMVKSSAGRDPLFYINQHKNHGGFVSPSQIYGGDE